LRSDLEDLTAAETEYKTGVTSALSGQSELAEAFLKMAQQKRGKDNEETNASEYLSDAEHFQDVNTHTRLLLYPNHIYINTHL